MRFGDVRVVERKVREVTLGEWVADGVLEGLGDVWRFAGARHAVQGEVRVGGGFVGWRWRGSVFEGVV